MSNETVQRELTELRAELEQLRAKVDRAPRRRWVWPAVAVVLISSFAWAQLVSFNADEPAYASAVNGNFNQLKTWLEQKVGTVGSNTITTGQVVIGAATNQTTLTVNATGQLQPTGGLALPEGTGITSSRFGVATPVANANIANFSGGFLEGTFSDTGGTIVIMASATGWCSAPGRITMLVKVDGTTVGSMRLLCQTSNTHMSFPAAFLRLNRNLLTSPAFGPSVVRTVRLEPINCASGCSAGLVTTNVDLNDWGEVTVLRLPTQ